MTRPFSELFARKVVPLHKGTTEHKYDEGNDGKHAWTARKPNPSAEEQHRRFIERVKG